LRGLPTQTISRPNGARTAQPTGGIPSWIDRHWRFVHAIDNSLIGFVTWHRYGDRREHGESGALRDGTTHGR